MADIELGVNRQQLEQIEQPLKIQKTGIAMAFKGLLSVGCGPDAAIQASQFVAKQ